MSHRLVANSLGIFEIRWTEGRRSKRISTGTRNIQEAGLFLAQWAAKVSKAAAPAKIGPILESYWTSHGSTVRSADTIRGHIRWLTQAFGFLDVEELRSTDITDYIRKRGKGLLGDRPVSTGTIRRELGILKAALFHAVDIRMIRRDSVPTIPLPPDGPPRERYLDVSEIEALFLAARALRAEMQTSRLSRMERFIAIALFTGARQGAIRALTWDRVDLARRMIDFRDPSLTVTKKRRVIVPISDALYPTLVKAHAEKRGIYVLDNAGSIRTSFNRVVAQAGLEDVSPHVLRHTWASQASMEGVPLTDISRVLGNTLSICERVYAKFQPEYLTAAVNKAYGGRTFDIEERA
jgi:integrase